MSDRPVFDNEDPRTKLEQWKVGELRVSGDCPPPSKEYDDWLYLLLRNDKRAAKAFVYEGHTYSIASHWLDRTGKVMHLHLQRG